MKTKEMIYTALMTAFICVLSPLSLPISYIPISLATLAVMLSGMIFGRKIGTLSTTLYIVLGAIGVPVFAGYTAGFSVLFGVTGGYLIGYIVLAYFTGLVSDLVKSDTFKKRAIFYSIGMIIGTILLYLIGTIYFEYLMKLPLWSALTACVIPFIPGDLIKIAITIIIGDKIKKSSWQITNYF